MSPFLEPPECLILCVAPTYENEALSCRAIFGCCVLKNTRYHAIGCGNTMLTLLGILIVGYECNNAEISMLDEVRKLFHKFRFLN
jgi:hypothetical protein